MLSTAQLQCKEMVSFLKVFVIYINDYIQQLGVVQTQETDRQTEQKVMTGIVVQRSFSHIYLFYGIQILC